MINKYELINITSKDLKGVTDVLISRVALVPVKIETVNHRKIYYHDREKVLHYFTMQQKKQGSKAYEARKIMIEYLKKTRSVG